MIFKTFAVFPDEPDVELSDDEPEELPESDGGVMEGEPGGGAGEGNPAPEPGNGVDVGKVGPPAAGLVGSSKPPPVGGAAGGATPPPKIGGIPPLYAGGVPPPKVGGGVYGVEGAARTYFHVSAADLGPSESALLAAAIVNPRLLNPARPTPRLIRRQRLILRRMGAVTPPQEAAQLVR
jgi:hypothetical protein